MQDKIDLHATEICADPSVDGTDLPDRLVPLLIASGIHDALAAKWVRAHPTSRAEREDFASTMFLHLTTHLEAVDRERIARGASFCGWLRQWGATISLQVEREVTATTSRAAVPTGKLVSLDELSARIGDIGNLRQVRRLAPPAANSDPDLMDPAQIRARLARRRGAGRQEAVSRVLHDALGHVPPLLRPTDPAETQLVRRLISQCPRLARISLDTFRARVDDAEPGGRLAPEAMIAMWDATTPVERQYLAGMTDRLLALLVEDAVRLAPRPRPAVRRAVRRSLEDAARRAPARLLDDLTQAFWDEATEAVSSHRTDITDAERQRMHREAELRARRLPGLVAELLRVPGQQAGRDTGQVRAFLCRAWAIRESQPPRRRPLRTSSGAPQDPAG